MFRFRYLVLLVSLFVLSSCSLSKYRHLTTRYHPQETQKIELSLEFSQQQIETVLRTKALIHLDEIVSNQDAQLSTRHLSLPQTNSQYEMQDFNKKQIEPLITIASSQESTGQAQIEPSNAEASNSGNGTYVVMGILVVVGFVLLLNYLGLSFGSILLNLGIAALILLIVIALLQIMVAS